MFRTHNKNPFSIASVAISEREVLRKCLPLVNIRLDSLICFGPVSQGFRPPGDKSLGISPPRGQIPGDLALPARPPFWDLAPPRPNDTFQRIFLYLDLATKKASEIWFSNLFDNGFARVRLRANVV